MPKDNSFVSRHDKFFEPKFIDELKMNSQSVVYFDLFGMPNWQNALFGDLTLVNNQVHWQKSTFVQALENDSLKGEVKIILKNVPSTAIKSIKEMLLQAKARGYFTYHHQQILIPDAINFGMNASGYDFEKLTTVIFTKKTKMHDLPQNIKLINTTLFDLLLSDKKVEKGTYHKLNGLLESAKNSDLTLYLSSNLSENQWYCLCKMAERHQVQLYLYHAEQVKLPPKLAVQVMVLEKSNLAMVVHQKQTEPCVFVSDNPSQAIKILQRQYPEAYVFAIEDYDYRDLISGISYQYQNQQFCDFEEHLSQVLNVLKDGKNVIVYGDFSTPMLQALQPFLLEQTLDRKKSYSGQLILCVDDKKQAQLDFLAEDAILHLPSIKAKAQSEQVVYNEVADLNLDLTNSSIKSKQFMTSRLLVLTDTIRNFPITHLEGKTGVGKTFLIEKLKSNHENEFVCFHELEHLSDWAMDTSDKVKVLFLDEINIANKHLTLLSPLKEGCNPMILYHGVIYPLTDKHRVVCASNPVSYGGGRKKQKLFAEGNIAKIHFEELPYYFIYEQNLKPFYMQVSAYLNEATFQQQCLRFLTEYHHRKVNQAEALCVRDLQEWLVTFTMQCIKEQPQKFFKHTKINLQPIETDLVITPSMKKLHKHFRRAIEVRKQRFIDNRRDCAGKNGVLIEGRPGMGKSDLVRLRLNKSGYIEEIPGQAPQNANVASYIKIDASLPDNIKKSQIQQAFHCGQAVWLDEVNSILDAGFEQWINAFLSGLDPDTHEAAARAGFMLIVTANSMGMEGRSLIGPALRGRLNEFSMPEPRYDDWLMIIQNKLPELDLALQTEMASDLARLFEEDKSLTLREITPKLSELAEIYTSAAAALISLMSHKS